MTKMTLALRATADTPVRGTANPAAQSEANPPTFKKSFPRIAARLCAVAALAAGFQILTPGPAAVATLSPALLSAPVAASASAAGFLPQRDAALFQAILAEAFPARTSDPATTGTVKTPDPDEMMQFGARRAPRWLVETILKAAEKTGVDPVYMMTLADVESSLLPAAKAPTSSAAGLFQFIDRTWLESSTCTAPRTDSRPRPRRSGWWTTSRCSRTRASAPGSSGSSATRTSRASWPAS
jgi:hypothetical protein